MRDSLITSLINMNGSTNASVFLNILTVDQLNVLYPLFIEASEKLLKAFSKLSIFQTVVNNALQNIDAAKCCDFARGNRQIFDKYALPYVTSNRYLTYSNLLKLGKCFATALPLEKLGEMSETDFLKYFPNVGKTFQPDSNETQTVIAKINSLADSQSSLESYVFSSLKDLAMYYSNLSSLNSTSFKDNGASLIRTILNARDTTNIDIQKCRLGVDNDANSQALLRSIQNSFVNNYLGINSANNRRLKRSSSALTCDDLNNLSTSLSSISANVLATLSTTEFYKCQTLLGSSNIAWSSSQLATLVAKAKQAYPDLSQISDTNIAQLNAIWLGFDASDLALLKFNALSSISALGALTAWSSTQLTSGLRTGIEVYVAANGGILTSNMVNSMSNLACSLSASQVSGMSSSAFE